MSTHRLVKSLDYIVLVVENLDRSLAFYVETLGLPLKHRREAFAQIDTGTTRLGLYTRDDMAATLGRAPAAGKAEKFELGFFVDDCDAVFSELVANGVPAVTPPASRAWGQRTAYLSDPDGNLIELVETLAPGLNEQT